MVELIIDQEFRDLIPPLNEDEFNGLERSIKSEGCRDPIIIWNNIIIDGHNRYNICKKNNIIYNVINSKIELKTREDVIDWMYSNQLSRRNLTADQQSYFRGKQYTLRKSMIGGDRGNQYTKEAGNHNDYLAKPIVKQEKTIEIMAKEYGVGQATIQRDEKYSIAVDNVAKIALENSDKTIGFSVLRDKITSNKINAPKKAIMELSVAPKETVEKIFKLVNTEQAKGVQDAKRIIAAEKVKDVPHMDGKYKVIYADPPWSYGGSMNETYGTADKHYPTMSIEDICKLPVKDLSDDNAVLFLWTTSPQLEDTFKVINSWGFKYKASFVWDKIKHVMGHYNSVRHEFLLIATKGSCTPEVMKLFDSVVSEERTEHSKKPEQFRDIINTLYPSGKRIELFARNKSDGWEVWGNQI